MAIEGKKKVVPTWRDVKTNLADLDRAGLFALVQDMYSSSKENQIFLHARFALGDDTLKPYKATISRWLWPNVFKNQNYSISKAKKALSDYKKAVGRPGDLAELMAFYCEQAAGFSNEVGLDDGRYYDSLLSVFSQVLTLSVSLPAEPRDAIFGRLDNVRQITRNLGFGVGDEMDESLEEYQVDD